MNILKAILCHLATLILGSLAISVFFLLTEGNDAWGMGGISGLAASVYSLPSIAVMLTVNYYSYHHFSEKSKYILSVLSAQVLCGTVSILLTYFIGEEQFGWLVLPYLGIGLIVWTIGVLSALDKREPIVKEGK